MKKQLKLLIGLCLLSGSLRAQEDALARSFIAPPDSAKPHTWWHWMNGNITREGITADLEAMKHVGISGAQIFNVDEEIPEGPAPFLSPQWLELFRFAAPDGKLVWEVPAGTWTILRIGHTPTGATNRPAPEAGRGAPAKVAFEKLISWPEDIEWAGLPLKRWPEWLLKGAPRPVTERVTFTTWHHWRKDSQLLPSGLLGPVMLRPLVVVPISASGNILKEKN